MDVDPADYLEARQQATHKYGIYRSQNASTDPERTRPEWQKIPIPVPDTKSNVAATGSGAQWDPLPYAGSPDEPDLDGIARSTLDPKDRAYRPYMKRAALKRWLHHVPNVKFVKTLGSDNKNLTVLARYSSRGEGKEKDFAIKVGLPVEGDEVLENSSAPGPLKRAENNWVSEDIRREEKYLKQFARCKHIIQTLQPEECGLPPRQQSAQLEPQAADSTDDDDDNDEDRPPPAKRQRLRRRREDWAGRRERARAEWRAHRLARAEERHEEDPHRDYLLLEHLPHGSVRDLICALRERGDVGTPNRVLWSFWLCLVRACVGLAFPVRKFHPDRKTQQDSDLRETIPDYSKLARKKRWVHFNIHPGSVMIGRIDTDPEHGLIPCLKLADVDPAVNVKIDKRDVYYSVLRDHGQHGFYAPEQFVSRWDQFGADADSVEIGKSIRSRSAVAANYQDKMNIWGIANVMFCLITQMYPPVPPQPQAVKATFGAARTESTILSYGHALLDDQKYGYIDRELRMIVAKCMAHRPYDRPSLNECVDEAVEGQMKNEFGLNPATGEPIVESDQMIRQWIALVNLDTFGRVDSGDEEFSASSSDDSASDLLSRSSSESSGPSQSDPSDPSTEIVDQNRDKGENERIQYIMKGTRKGSKAAKLFVGDKKTKGKAGQNKDEKARQDAWNDFGYFPLDGTVESSADEANEADKGNSNGEEEGHPSGFKWKIKNLESGNYDDSPLSDAFPHGMFWNPPEGPRTFESGFHAVIASWREQLGAENAPSLGDMRTCYSQALRRWRGLARAGVEYMTIQQLGATLFLYGQHNNLNVQLGLFDGSSPDVPEEKRYFDDWVVPTPRSGADARIVWIKLARDAWDKRNEKGNTKHWFEAVTPEEESDEESDEEEEDDEEGQDEEEQEV
ncbi:hypothetical protein GGR56DRAFT_695160 [Xylariaceae sp. FL0804]|nr:hypothetical protein GGR56DRAFT_695160 [Xylariaceae sp. FL0804]